MAVGAQDVALGDFFVYASQGSLASDQIRDVLRLRRRIPVVELEDDDVSLAAGNTRVLQEVFADPTARGVRLIRVVPAIAF